MRITITNSLEYSVKFEISGLDFASTQFLLQTSSNPNEQERKGRKKNKAKEVKAG